MKLRCHSKNSKKGKDIKKTYAFLRAVADANRLKIICLLQKDSKCVCEIVPVIGISEKLASHHLKQLKNIELLNEKREGNFIRYSLNKKVIREYKKIFNQLIK
jgi:ArsR family transcriptional regulator, arsenate/arsenite/antimonite-responsive transcriptional repressor